MKWILLIAVLSAACKPAEPAPAAPAAAEPNAAEKYAGGLRNDVKAAQDAAAKASAATKKEDESGKVPE